MPSSEAMEGSRAAVRRCPCRRRLPRRGNGQQPRVKPVDRRRNPDPLAGASPAVGRVAALCRARACTAPPLARVVVPLPSSPAGAEHKQAGARAPVSGHGATPEPRRGGTPPCGNDGDANGNANANNDVVQARALHWRRAPIRQTRQKMPHTRPYRTSYSFPNTSPPGSPSTSVVKRRSHSPGLSRMMGAV